MKRLIVLFLVFVIVAAVVFYFGWIQIQLDEDSYAVIFTKTGGWEETVIAPAEFTWRWQRLLPTNLALHVIPIIPHSTTATVSGSLPSATTYGALLESASPFSYAISVHVVYRLKPDALPGLVRDDGLRSDALGTYYGRIDTEMEQVITDSTMRLLGQPAQLISPASALTTVVENLTATLTRWYPELEFLSVGPTRLELPDIELYFETRQRYITILDARTEAMQTVAKELATDQTATDAELARLERYGEILERYPILLDYFSLTQDVRGDPLELESLVPQPGS
ncbi:MAG: hypothetical protein V3S41_05795 [Spirochaetia bacterium]